MTAKPAPFGVFQPIESDTSSTINAAFTPDGQTVYFSKSHPGWAGLTIFKTVRRGSTWTTPVVASFSGVYRDTDPAVTPDGEGVIFARAINSDSQSSLKYALYRASLAAAPDLSPEPLNIAVEGGGNVLYPSITRDGTLYFTKSVGATSRIMRSRLLNGKYQPPESVNLPGDSPTVNDFDATIAPDGSFIVFASNRQDTLGASDLYIAFQKTGTWCTPIHLEAPVNSKSPELATGLSVDGKTLYFASSRSSVVQPRPTRIDASGFRAETSTYESGFIRTYQADITDWLEAFRPRRGDNSCPAASR